MPRRASRDCSIRAALGASRGRIARLLVTDSVVLTLAAGCAGLATAGIGIRIARLSPELPHIADAALNAQTALFVAALALGSGVLVSVPALIAASLTGTGGALRIESRRTGRDRRTSRMRAVFVAAEFALALPLLASACWFLQSMWRLQAVDPGFAIDGGVTLNLQLAGPRYATPEARAAFWQRLEDRARKSRNRRRWLWHEHAARRVRHGQQL